MHRNVRAFSVLLFAVIVILSSPRSVFGSEGFLYGIDVLDRNGCDILEGRKTALVTNKAGITVEGEPNYLVLLRHGVELRYLMAPEHGFDVSAAAGERVDDERLGGSFPIYSLYGKTRVPSDEQLGMIDVLVFDLQDIGARCYTYISTMFHAMKAVMDNGKEFVVLDRPNPIAPVSAAGFLLEPEKSSFVGTVPVPFVHAMTVGEIALWLQKNFFPALRLRVVPMEGYDRSVFADEIENFRFISPSPNIPDVLTALVYPATVFLEATNISEGRGTRYPFRQFGAPFIDGRRLQQVLQTYGLPGVQFHAVTFFPESSKFAGEECGGVFLDVTDRYRFEPFTTGVAILLALHELYPGQFDLSTSAGFFDKLAGTSRLRHMVGSSASLDEIVEAARQEVDEFDRNNPDRLLY